ncbi:MAG: hypothetical protein ACOY3L_03645 [Pseudomonadota bacterium]
MSATKAEEVSAEWEPYWVLRIGEEKSEVIGEKMSAVEAAKMLAEAQPGSLIALGLLEYGTLAYWTEHKGD